MADIADTEDCFSRVSTNSEVKNNVLVCKMYKECEFQLKETLDELNSIIMINKLLQKETASVV
jgi:hypothetical protein